ncbi:MAG: hypothetical protein H6662_15455 [Ardenticatenaceae bacterium]|nr:hypothetical protein [Anaerolineales bacterium]MCB8922983.1 hypothetical protein [Ardenticatenaceae bacterium]MCB8990284.1 hypothetical protein [Ardenticatenaceae bacterium]
MKEKEAFLKKLSALEPFDSTEQRNSVVCALIGHSRIQTTCFGYYYCARCGAQLGDALGGVYYGAETAVIVGHKCETCLKNAETLTWQDTLFCPDPFEEES